MDLTGYSINDSLYDWMPLIRKTSLHRSWYAAGKQGLRDLICVDKYFQWGITDLKYVISSIQNRYNNALK